VPSGRLLGGIWEDGDFGGKLAVAGIDTDGDGCSLDQVEQRSGMPFHKCGTVWRLLRTIPSDKIKEISDERVLPVECRHGYETGLGQG
jgi:hypothetical protein